MAFSFKSLRGKILASTVTATAVLLLSLGAFMMVRSSMLMQGAIESKAQSLIALAEKVGIPYINNYDYPALDVLTKEIVADPDVEWLMFYDAKGTALTSSSQEQPPAAHSVLEERELMNPDGKGVLARLKFSYSTQAVQAQLQSDMMAIGAAIFAGGIFMTVLMAFIANAVIRPIRHAAVLMGDIAEGEGDLTKRLEVRTRDEIGDMAEYFNRFIDKLQGIVAMIAGNANALASSSTELASVSAQSAENVHTLSARTSSVAAAAEEMSSNTVSVAASMEQTSTNLATVASATEEMTSTIAEIAGSTERAKGTTARAAAQIDEFAAVLRSLGEAVQEINKVTESISGISSQTNLLALNATIEAARAGEAGRGFAVVANEIKELANQTTVATEEIRKRIDNIQRASGSAVMDVQKIVAVIGDVNAIVTDIALAIEEQAGVIQGLATNIAEASAGVQDANIRAADMASVSREIASDMTSIDTVTAEIRSGGKQVQGSAAELSVLSEKLKSLVGLFRI